MITFPNCKINIGLNVVEKRNDGYHNIETIFYPIQLHDILEIVIPHPNIETTKVYTYGISISSDVEHNLCNKAYNMFRKLYDISSVEIYLYKNIPMGAGLGGGSSDAAFVLKMLNSLYKIGLTQEQLAEIAISIGSDCPFFIFNQPMLAKGRGEILSPITINLSGYYLIVIKPPIFVSTAEAYKNIYPKKPDFSLINISKLSLFEWKKYVVNDFENVVFKIYPQLLTIKNFLYEIGAIYASMSGSGSSIYGVFENDVKNIQDLFPDCFVWKQLLI